MPIRGVLSQLVHECADYPGSQLVDAVIVIAEFRKLTFGFVVSYQPLVVTDGADSGTPYGRQTVGNNGQSGNTKSHRAKRRVIVQRHFNALIRVLVMHE